MCLSVFLYSDTELPLVAWDSMNPGFHVSALEPHEESARRIVQSAFAYSLGAHTLCGCGFQLTDDEDPADVEESVAALVSYLRSAEGKSRLHLYVCWNGDASTEDMIVRSLSLDELVSGDDWLAEGTLTEIRSAAA